MRLALTGLTALRIWRGIRTGKLPDATVGERIDLPAPDPAPHKRWTPKTFDLSFVGIEGPLDDAHPIHVAVPEAKKRIRARGVTCSAYAGIPSRSFVDIGHGVAIARPELIFAEMGAAMSLPIQLLLGYELCGCYSRDALDPRGEGITYSLIPSQPPMRLRITSRGATICPAFGNRGTSSPTWRQMPGLPSSR